MEGFQRGVFLVGFMWYFVWFLVPWCLVFIEMER